MAVERKGKKDKEIVLETENSIKEIQQQLLDQLRCFDLRLDSHVGLLMELQDFYRQQGEIEREVAKSLDKLLKQITARHKAERQRREGWKLYTTYKTWESLQEVTKQRVKDHNAMSEIYGQIIYNKLSDILDDLQRINKRCRDMTVMSQTELSKVLGELINALKSYHQYHGDSQQSETKLMRVQSQRQKSDQQSIISKRFRNYEKESEKKHQKFTERKQKATKARNEYLLCIDAANSALNKYFKEDVPNLMKKMEDGYHVLLSQILTIHVEAESKLISSNQQCLQCLSDRLNGLEGSTALLIQAKIFNLPPKFEFQPHKGDTIRQLHAPNAIHDDMVSRMISIKNRLEENEKESQAAITEMTEAEHLMMEKITMIDWDVSGTFKDPLGSRATADREKRKTARSHAEDSFFLKYHEVMRLGNVSVRLKAKLDSMVQVVGRGDVDMRATSGQGHNTNRPPSLPPKPKRISSFAVVEKVKQNMPKLFGGTLEEYYKATGEVIPSVVLSCVRIINLYGMHHQGIFRVSGSQNDINNFRQEFDKGLDPLSIADGDDINSVAGLLKLYFRELREPLFPTALFDQLMQYTQAYNMSAPVDICTFNKEQELEWVSVMKSVIESLSQSSIIVLRYVFAFLHHVSEFSDENMMDAYNLAVCFGPTLLPVPHGQDLVQVQTYVNELVKNLVLHQDELFPSVDVVPGVVYEKCIASDELDRDMIDYPMSDDDLLTTSIPERDEDHDSDSDLTDEEDPGGDRRSGGRKAVAQFRFEGRLEDELSFDVGDVLILSHRLSADWWKGSLNGREGRIPAKYIEHDSGARSKGRSSSTSTGLKLAEGLNRSTECLMSAPYSQGGIHASQPNLSTEQKDPSALLRGRPISGAKRLEHDSGISVRKTSSIGSADSKGLGRGRVVSGGEGGTEGKESRRSDDPGMTSARDELERLEVKVKDSLDLLDRALNEELNPSGPISTPDLIITDPNKRDPVSTRSAGAQPDLISRSDESEVKVTEGHDPVRSKSGSRPHPPIRTTPVGSVSEESRRHASTSDLQTPSSTVIQIGKGHSKVVEGTTSFGPRMKQPDSTSTFRSTVPASYKGAAALSSSDLRRADIPSGEHNPLYKTKSSTLPPAMAPSEMTRSISPSSLSSLSPTSPRSFSESKDVTDTKPEFSTSTLPSGFKDKPAGVPTKPVPPKPPAKKSITREKSPNESNV